MKITKYGSSTVLIETNGISILCDPWLVDGVLYGAWCNYPPINLEEIDFSIIDFVYISHVHPDHFDAATMAYIDKKVPVLIHNYHAKFLKANVERLGFTVIELDHGRPYQLTRNVKISIYGADDCDPTVCGHLFDCITSDIKGSMQLDSLCVIEDSDFVLVNTNDCPYEIAKTTIKKLKIKYPVIDFALVGYTSASLFPHCVMDYNEHEMKNGKKIARMRGLDSGLNHLRELKPKYYMPFAGTYIIGGKQYKKNDNLSLPELTEAIEYFQNDSSIKNAGCDPILLNFNSSFNLETKQASAEYVEISPSDRREYIENVASKFSYPFDTDEIPTNSELLNLFEKACVRMRAKQLRLNKFEDTNIVFDVSGGKYILINLIDSKPTIIEKFEQLENYHRFRVDLRLLKRALMGPRLANWNNIESSGHLDFARKPDVYHMGVHILMNAMHV